MWRGGRRRRRNSSSLHSVLDNFGVDLGHSVDSMRSHDAQVGHVNLLHVSFLDQGHAAQALHIAWVQLGDALQRVEEQSHHLLLHSPSYLDHHLQHHADPGLSCRTSRCLLLIS